MYLKFNESKLPIPLTKDKRSEYYHYWKDHEDGREVNLMIEKGSVEETIEYLNDASHCTSFNVSNPFYLNGFEITKIEVWGTSPNGSTRRLEYYMKKNDTLVIFNSTLDEPVCLDFIKSIEITAKKPSKVINDKAEVKLKPLDLPSEISYLKSFYLVAKSAIEEDLIEYMDSTMLIKLVQEQFNGSDLRVQLENHICELKSFIESSKASSDELSPYEVMLGALLMIDLCDFELISEMHCDGE